VVHLMAQMQLSAQRPLGGHGDHPFLTWPNGSSEFVRKGSMTNTESFSGARHVDERIAEKR